MTRLIVDRVARWIGLCVVLFLALATPMPWALAQPGDKAHDAPVAPIAVQNILASVDDQEQRIGRIRKILAGPDPALRLQRRLDAVASSKMEVTVQSASL